jgi:hypothetical protein
MQQIRNVALNKKASELECLLICNNLMVRQCDLRWNPTYDSILLIYKKLLALGFIYLNGEITIENLDNE